MGRAPSRSRRSRRTSSRRGEWSRVAVGQTGSSVRCPRTRPSSGIAASVRGGPRHRPATQPRLGLPLRPHAHAARHPSAARPRAAGPLPPLCRRHRAGRGQRRRAVGVRGRADRVRPRGAGVPCGFRKRW
jgi:hypothetical protein